MSAPAGAASDPALEPTRPEVDYRRLMPPLALGLAVATLVVGAVLAGVDTGGRLDQAQEMLARLYERGDVDAVLDRLVPGSFGADPVTGGQLRPPLQELLAGPLQVISSELVSVRGTRLAVIRTPDVAWCVLPDGRLLLGCRVAAAEVTVEVQGAALDAPFAGLEVFEDRLELLVLLVTPRRQEVRLGQVRIEGPPGGADLRLARAAYAARGQQVPAGTRQLMVHPGVGLLLTFEATDVTRFDATLEGPFLVRWPGGSLRLSITGLRWFVGPGSPPAGAAR